MTFEIEAGGARRRVDVRRTPRGWTVIIDDVEVAADVAPVGAGSSLLIRPGGDPAAPARSYEIAIDEREDSLTVHIDGVAVPVTVADRRRLWSRGGRDQGAVGSGPRSIVAPMPGRIVKVLVAKGEQVSARQGLVVVEAMKMENELRSPRAGIVAEVRVSEGMSVDANAILVVIE